MRVVIDTNVVMSRFMNPSGTPARLLAAWEQERFELLLSEAILAEYERVLAYPTLQRYHHLSDEQVRRILERFRRFGTLIVPDRSLDVIKVDPTDNVFLECGIAGQAGAIISGDRHLLGLGSYEGIPILRPAAFLALLEGYEGSTPS